MEGNFFSKYLANHKAKEKHADFMMKMAEIILALVFAGLLSVPAMELGFSGKASCCAVVVDQEGFPLWYLILIVGGAAAGIWMMFKALKSYSELPPSPVEKSAPKSEPFRNLFGDSSSDVEVSISGNAKVSIDGDKSITTIRIRTGDKESGGSASNTDADADGNIVF